MGGTLALHSDSGFKVGIIDLTQAELSSNGTVAIRQEEAEKAARVLGLSVRQNLGFPDRGLLERTDIIPVLVDLIRTYEPTLVFAPYEVDRHPDHGHCGRLVEEAVFSAGIHKYQGREGRPAHKVTNLYSYFINGFHSPDFVVDITAVQSKKREALQAYKSQFIKEVGGVETPLTTGYVETVESRDRLFGKEVGLAFAEGFTSKKPLVKHILL
jgi:N-acetylglucosamine malate deacetylase 1